MVAHLASVSDAGGRNLVRGIPGLFTEDRAQGDLRVDHDGLVGAEVENHVGQRKSTEYPEYNGRHVRTLRAHGAFEIFSDHDVI